MGAEVIQDNRAIQYSITLLIAARSFCKTKEKQPWNKAAPPNREADGR